MTATLTERIANHLATLPSHVAERLTARLLREALAELRPADDEQPTTEEWLLSIGFRIELDGLTVMRNNRYSLAWYGDGWFGLSKSGEDFKAQTRGDVRRLLTVLGIEVTK